MQATEIQGNSPITASISEERNKIDKEIHFVARLISSVVAVSDDYGLQVSPR